MTAKQIRALDDNQLEMLAKDHELVNKYERRWQPWNWRIDMLKNHAQPTVEEVNGLTIFATWRDAVGRIEP